MSYVHGTSPRKYERTCDVERRAPRTRPKKVNRKAEKKKTVYSKYFTIGVTVIIAFAFLISYRSSLIEEKSVRIQEERNAIEQLKNENVELNLGLQKALSLTNIEKQAKNKLGMQKLQNNQIRYIKIEKEDYVEPVSSTRIEEKQLSFFEKVINFFTNKD